MDVMSAALGGMCTAQNSLEKSGERIAGATVQPQDSVDLSTEMVEMLAAANQYQANARVIQNTDTMEKKLLNILA
jgi:flagellar basal body rod protein FlgC